LKDQSRFYWKANFFRHFVFQNFWLFVSANTC